MNQPRSCLQHSQGGHHGLPIASQIGLPGSSLQTHIWLWEMTPVADLGLCPSPRPPVGRCSSLTRS